jgi:sporulation protein YlmC with PRC-barrel domain
MGEGAPSHIPPFVESASGSAEPRHDFYSREFRKLPQLEGNALMADTDVETDETTRLIASNKVEGTTVYNESGEKLGSIYNFMVNKRSGQVEYAVLTFGGLFGLGADYYPLPWSVLTYDTNQGGYVVNLDKSLLEKAPRYSNTDEPEFDRDYGREVYGYYGVNYPF